MTSRDVYTHRLMLGVVAQIEPLSYTALVGDCSCRRSSDLDLTASANPRGVFFGAHDFLLQNIFNLVVLQSA